MKKIIALLALVASTSFGATLTPIQLISTAGSTNNQVITSSGSATSWANQLIQSVAGRTGTIVLSNTDIGGLGSSATVNTGTSGGVIPLLSTANTWTLAQIFSVPTGVSSGGTGVATLTGLALGNGTSAMSAYGGTSCTNQFTRSLNASGAATCATVSLTTDVTGITPTVNGGTGIAFFTAAGPTVARVYTFPDAAATILYAGGALGTPASGVATNLTGTAAGLTSGAVTTNANLTGPITSSGNTTSVASQTGTGSTFAMNTNPVFIGPTLGAALATSINGNAITTGTGTLTLGAGKTTTFDHTSTFTTTDGVTYTFPTTTATLARTDAAQTFAGVQTFSGQHLAANGTAALPSYGFSTDGGVGFYYSGGGVIQMSAQSGTSQLAYNVTTYGDQQFRATGALRWSSTSAPTGAADIGVSRVAAGVVGVGTGATGDFSGGVKTGNLINTKQNIDLSYTYNQPTTGSTVTLATGTQTAIIDPAGTLATLTITLPACTSGYDGSIARYGSSQAVTVLTVNATSGSVVGGPTSLALGQGSGYICRGANTTWYRLY